MSCEHDMANGTCSICDPYVVQNLRAHWRKIGRARSGRQEARSDDDTD